MLMKKYFIIELILCILVLSACAQKSNLTSDKDLSNQNPPNTTSAPSEPENTKPANLKEKIADLRIQYKDNPLVSYTFGQGRSDIQTKKTYHFELPGYIKQEIMGEDASSGCEIFSIDDVKIFSLCGTDISVNDEEEAKIRFCDTKNRYLINTVGGHTNCLSLNDEAALDEYELFVETFTINDQKVFKNQE